MNHLLNLGIIYGVFLITVYVLWQRLRVVVAYVGFDESRAGEKNYFLCNGVADNIQIQQAIDYVASHSRGGITYLEKGTFQLLSPIQLPSKMALDLSDSSKEV